MNHFRLLLAINRCTELDKARANGNHPCSKIVGLQHTDVFQAPEPWRGHIDTALILFISSNPSISGEEIFPPPNWPDENVVAHYQGCFDRDNSAPSNIDERNYSSVQFWREVRGRATEILGRPAVQGTDFALTELVHCKSTREQGVSEALHHCADLWLEQVIEQSSARIIVTLGNHARALCAELWGISSNRCVHFGVNTKGGERAVVILPHPNARKKRKLEHHTTEGERLRLRSLLY